jgi:hypothetical protein
MMLQPIRLPGDFTISPGPAQLPAASSYQSCIAWVTDRPSEPGPMISDGVTWRYFISGKRVEVFNGVTGADGKVGFTYSAPFSQVDHISQERFPPTSANQFARMFSQDLSGCVVICEQRASLSVLGLDLLSFAVTPVAGQRVSICAVGF